MGKCRYAGNMGNNIGNMGNASNAGNTDNAGTVGENFSIHYCPPNSNDSTVC